MNAIITIALLVFILSSTTFRLSWPQPMRRRRLGRIGLRSASTVSKVGRWSDGVIYYRISRSLARYQSLILDAFARIESRTCIRFKPRQRQRDYVLLVNGNGCHSQVGRAGGRQIVSLGEGCHDVGSAMHEMCHAIGLYHEHMRYDRDQYLQIVWRNIQPSMYNQFQKVPASAYQPASKFDYNSIMIYGSKAFSRNKRYTMLPRARGVQLTESHFKSSLSQGDITNINLLYNCSS